MRDSRFFSKTQWHNQIQAQFHGLENKASELTETQLSSSTDEVLIERLVAECRLDIPVINEDEITVSSKEVNIEGRKGLAITVEVPFTGDQDLFHVQPPTFGASLPYGDIYGGKIHFTVVGVDFDQRSPKPQIDRNIQGLQQNLQWQREALGDFHSLLATRAAAAIQARRKKLQANASVLDNLGYKKR